MPVPVRGARKAVLLDIEGTISPVAFVRDVLFPYSHSRLAEFAATHRDRPDVAGLMEAAAARAGGDPVAALLGWHARDEKIPELKALQGLIWEEGYQSGALRGFLYADALTALRQWNAAGLPLYIYSSGSLHAQELFFRWNAAGDLRPLFSGFFDTGTGPKNASASYQKIAATLGAAPCNLVFFSDNARELEAAEGAGCQVVQVIKDETARDPRFASITDFSEYDLTMASPASC